MMKDIPIELQHITLTNFFLFIFAIVLTITIANSLSTLIKNIFDSKINQSVIKWTSKVTTYLIYLFGFYYSFTEIIKFNLPAVLTALGVFGAFCFVPTIPVLQNVIAGIFVAFTRPFKEGEYIDLGGELCEVIDIMILKTKLKGTSGRIIFIPNISLITGNIFNYSRGRFLKVDLSFNINNNTKFDQVENLLTNICIESQNILPSIKMQKLNKIQQYFYEKAKLEDYEPVCLIKTVNKDTYTINLSFWILDIKNRDRIIHEVHEKILIAQKTNNFNFA